MTHRAYKRCTSRKMLMLDFGLKTLVNVACTCMFVSVHEHKHYTIRKQPQATDTDLNATSVTAMIVNKKQHFRWDAWRCFGGWTWLKCLHVQFCHLLSCHSFLLEYKRGYCQCFVKVNGILWCLDTKRSSKYLLLCWYLHFWQTVPLRLTLHILVSYSDVHHIMVKFRDIF